MSNKLKIKNKKPYSDLYLDDKYRKIKISKTKFALRISDQSIKLIDIYNSPHYYFVKNYINKTDKYPIKNILTYEQYYENKWTNRSPEYFKELVDDISDYFDYKRDPIIVFKGIRPIKNIGSWVVVDGFHRIAILAALNNKAFKAKALRRINPGLVGKLFEKFTYL